MNSLRDAVREAAGRKPEPSVGCIDSQTAKTADQGRDVGYDGGKRANGRKRHIVTDVLGLLLLVTVTAASVQDAAAADPLLRKLNSTFPTIELVHADLGYRGPWIPRQTGDDGGERTKLWTQLFQQAKRDERLLSSASTLGRRTHFCVVQSLSTTQPRRRTDDRFQ